MYVAGIDVVERNHGLVISLFFFTVLAVAAVTMRLFTRLVLVRAVGVDDVFITIAALGTMGFLIAVMEQIRYGLGDSVDYEVLPNFLQSLLATIIAYTFTHFSVKFSICFQCKRIFHQKSAQRLFLGLIAWLTAYGLFCIFSTIITCLPVQKYWDDSIPGGCIDRSIQHYVFAGINILNDIVLLISPMPFLRSIQIARRAKYVLIGVFACGGFACIVAIVRLHSLYVNNSAPIDQQPIKGVDIAIWSGLEINVAIVCACVPALKPLFVKVFPRLITSFSNSSKRSGSGADGNIHLRSFDRERPAAKRNELDSENTLTASSSGGIEIQVHKSFDAKSYREGLGMGRAHEEDWSGRTRIEGGHDMEDQQRLTV